MNLPNVYRLDVGQEFKERVQYQFALNLYSLHAFVLLIFENDTTFSELTLPRKLYYRYYQLLL